MAEITTELLGFEASGAPPSKEVRVKLIGSEAIPLTLIAAVVPLDVVITATVPAS